MDFTLQKCQQKSGDLFYCPQTKLREGNVFTGVCDSVYRGGGEGVPGPGGVCFGVGGVSAPGGGCLVPEGAWSRGGGECLLRLCLYR